MLPVFFGLAGPVLTPDERALFAACNPAGYILFSRNIISADQTRALTDDLRSLSGNPRLPILIDQEGGRVARLKAPAFPAFPPAADFGRLYDRAPISAMAAARANGEALGQLLSSLGISVNCTPVADVPVPGAHDVIGNRAFGTEPLRVAALARATLDGLNAGGTVGVLKHIPGHGRATQDSHHALPRVTAGAGELETDLAPFIRLKDAPMAMTAHILYDAWDPALCATLSPAIIHNIIRTRIGFDGLLMTDALEMHALGSQPGGNDMAARATNALAAGCDIALHCLADFAEMAAIADACPPITPAATDRLTRAMAWPTATDPAQDPAATRDELLALIEAGEPVMQPASPVDVW
ncbi:beta-N-acetylhexosaminidase [Sandaracinobacteroides saxicola]|uniref:beta-N-acetylhexosaminidase n=1 Tax=Sandaracinobacteroides saxicola TaxID=2759707 RepID=A0A7G5IK39_9SPHN|nr:beta-N-acetylhexosaminidase [Sandaracinobacteroides saxicola]QMW23731.1 beta-N-acetylhexosaminidase [Sandaracinobacteroides saxicola]